MESASEHQENQQGALGMTATRSESCSPRQDEMEGTDQFAHQQLPTQPASVHPLEIVDPKRHYRLSPSALDVAEATKKSNNFRSWPSFALDASNADAFARTSFLFADQLQPAEDNGKGTTSPRTARRVPINVLKLPWQHPFQNHESNRNPYKIPRALFAAVFLTTALALLSAWDAQNHCISNETDALMALLGEESEGNSSAEDGVEQDEQTTLSEAAVLEVMATCKQMFRQVMLPVGLVTGLSSLLALGILRQHQKSFGKNKPLMVQSPPCFYSFYLPLLFVSGLILAAWTVGIILVMLGPRNNDTDNPYTSLAAVDSMGRVADNANLYYMSWLSEGLAILIFYQLLGAFIRQHCHPMITQPAAAATISTTIPANSSTVSTASSAFFSWQHRHSLAPSMIAAKNSMDNSLVQFPTLPSPTTATGTTQRYHSSRMRIKWFQTFYQLRVRTGIWVAAMLCSLVVVASSAHLFREVLLPAAQSLYDDDDYLSYDHHNEWWNVIADNKSHKKVCVILAYNDSKLSEEMCTRTFFSLLSGFVAVILCTTAIILHLLTRRSAAADALYYEACGGVYHELALQMMATKHHHLPLRSELLLSVVLSLWLGWNALMVSGVQGPAPQVGNLYYASWLCFLLCLRICLGCVEEYFNINDDEDHEQQTSAQLTFFSTADNGKKARASYRAPDLSGAPASETPDKPQQPTKPLADEGNDKAIKDAVEKERAKRLRRYFFLGAFSTVCAGSAVDAAINQNYVLTLSEKYMILAPTTVAVLSAVLFMLCLSKVSYAIVSQVWCGGALSCATFGIWLVNLVLTMHSEDSWAVNGVGEIEMANLYYFSWASIITAGLQMTSYAKDALKLESEDFMLVVWAAIGKVCFVILGAAGHIWHTISDQCDIVEIQNSAITFCSRTVLAMIVSSTGLVIGCSVVCIRVLVPTRCFSNRSRAHCEAVISIFLVLLFAVAAAMITGIGGPGQSVGDLYYSTWLAFWVSIGIFVSCYDQIKLEEMESEEGNKTNRKAPTSDGVLV